MLADIVTIVSEKALSPLDMRRFSGSYCIDEIIQHPWRKELKVVKSSKHV